MRNSRIAAVLALATAATIPACWGDDQPTAWQRTRTVLGPIPLKTQIAYVDSALDRVTLVDLSADTPAIESTQIGRNAIYALPSADRHALFAITRGEQAIHPGEIDQDPLFWVVDTDHLDVSPAGYAIGSPFDRIALSPDGNTAITYFSASGPDDAGFFRNPNELAIVDLTQPPSATNPTLVTIRSFGSVPAGVSISPPMVIPGAADATPRSFAFVLSSDNLAVLDLTHPDRDNISIRLNETSTTVTPQQIVYAPDTASAYVRSANATDVLQILLEPETAVAPTDNDYRPVLAELGAGGGPTDIAVYDDASGQRYLLVATPNTGQIVVVNADTAQFRSIPVADPIDRIQLFPAGTGDPAVAPHQALLASIGAQLPRLWVLDLDTIEDPLAEPQLDEIDLDQPVLDVVPVPNRNLAMIVHDDARTVLGLLDMSTESTSPLLGVGELDSYDFSPDGSHLIGATDGVAELGFVELDNLHPTAFRLDDPPTTVLSTANGKIFVDHGDPLGHATILPSTDATRAQAIVLEGFLTANLLDQEP